MRAALALFVTVAAGCSSPADHATHSVELADTWTKQPSAPPEAALSVKFSMDLSFKLTTSDGTPFDGTFEVIDPLVLLTPSRETNVLWCIPRADFSGPNLDTVTFAVFDPAKCGTTPRGAGVQSPLEGAYVVAAAAQ